MSCEFLGTGACRITEAIGYIREGLGDAAKGTTPQELREIVCKDIDETLRKEGCRNYRIHKNLT